MVALVAWAPSLAAMPDDPCKPPPSFVLSLLSLPPRHAPAALLSKGEDEREGGAKGGRKRRGVKAAKKTRQDALGCRRFPLMMRGGKKHGTAACEIKTS